MPDLANLGRPPRRTPPEGGLTAVTTAARRRRLVAIGGAGAIALAAVVMLTLTGGSGPASLRPAILPTVLDTNSPATTGAATPEPTVSPASSLGVLPLPTGDGPAPNTQAPGSVTLSLNSPASSGHPATLRVHVITPDTWTAYMVSFNGTIDDQSTSRYWSSAGQGMVGTVDGEKLFEVCAKHGNVSTPTNSSLDLPFTPLAAGRFHATVRILHGSCTTDHGTSWLTFNLGGSHTITSSAEFTVTDSGWHYDVNGPAKPRVDISSTRTIFDDPNGPFCTKQGTETPGFEFIASDLDGPISSVTVDWGDGSPVEPAANALAGCLTFGSAGGVYAGIAYVGDYNVYHPDHTYSQPGTYPITVTAISGAGTRNPQTVTAKMAYPASGPTATATP